MPIVKCTCKNDFQDKQYGKGRRVANPCKPKARAGDKGFVRCTVCEREQEHTFR